MTPKNEVRLVLALEKIADLLQHSLRPSQAANGTKPSFEARIEVDHLPNPAVVIERTPTTGMRVTGRLASAGIQVTKSAEGSNLDNALSANALFMGEHFTEIRELLGRIKSALAYRGQFSLELKGRSPETISTNCQLANSLYRIAFLENYQFHKSPRCVIVARPSPMPVAQQFLTGKWFEMYCREKILAILGANGLGDRLDYLKNVQARLPDGEDFEFDFLVMVDEELFWFEQKTGCYQRHVDRYAQLAERLTLDARHAFLILPEVGDETTEVLCELFKMTVCDIDSFQSAIEEIASRLAGVPAADRPAIKAEPEFQVLVTEGDRATWLS